MNCLLVEPRTSLVYSGSGMRGILSPAENDCVRSLPTVSLVEATVFWDVRNWIVVLMSPLQQSAGHGDDMHMRGRNPHDA